MSLSPLAAAKDFDTLYAGCLEAAGLLCRVCRFCYIRSRATEDCSGTWGWAVLGISNEDLRSALEQFQTNLVSLNEYYNRILMNQFTNRFGRVFHLRRRHKLVSLETAGLASSVHHPSWSSF